MATIKLKQAVILAGGMGTRLRPLTNDRPKPMVLVNGKPFIEYLINLLKKNNIKEVVFLLGYMPEKIVEYFGDGSKLGIKIKYSIGKIEDETGTRIKKAGKVLDENFLLLYCDNYWPLNLDKMVSFYESKNTLASTTIYNNLNGDGEYGKENNVFVNKKRLVMCYDKTRTDSRLNGVDIGFFILSKNVLKKMPNGNFSFEREILPMLIKDKQLVGYITDDKYYTITTPNLVKKIEKIL